METENKDQIEKYKKLWEEHNKSFSTSDDTEYYLLSTKWMQAWKTHIGYKPEKMQEETETPPEEDNDNYL